MVDKGGCKLPNKSRRIESHDPTVTGVLGYNHTPNICRLVSNACQGSRQIILKFYHDRHNKSGLADSIDAHAELGAVRNSGHARLRHSAYYSPGVSTNSAHDLSVAHVQASRYPHTMVCSLGLSMLAFIAREAVSLSPYVSKNGQRMLL
ncbi:SNF2-related protein [Penicillium viridicatum]|nr:SNF2-related protein [Penicillium viridicatum]